MDITSPARNYQLINTHQKALNEDNVIALKRVIRSIIWDFERARLITEKRARKTASRRAATSAPPAGQVGGGQQRKLGLLDILLDIQSFHNHYNKRLSGLAHRLRFHRQSRYQHGMGLVALDTLPPRAIRTVLKNIATATAP